MANCCTQDIICMLQNCSCFSYIVYNIYFAGLFHWHQVCTWKNNPLSLIITYRFPLIIESLIVLIYNTLYCGNINYLSLDCTHFVNHLKSKL